MTIKDKLTKPLYQYSFDGDSYHMYIRFEDIDKIIEEQLKIVEECVNQKHKEILIGFLDFEKKPVSFPTQYKFLEDRFTYNSKERAFKSKRKRLGAGAGDDSSLFLSVDYGGTLIWWKSNRGHEDIVFDGKELKTEKEFNQVFELLEVNKILKIE